MMGDNMNQDDSIVPGTEPVRQLRVVVEMNPRLYWIIGSLPENECPAAMTCLDGRNVRKVKQTYSYALYVGAVR